MMYVLIFNPRCHIYLYIAVDTINRTGKQSKRIITYGFQIKRPIFFYYYCDFGATIDNQRVNRKHNKINMRQRQNLLSFEWNLTSSDRPRKKSFNVILAQRIGIRQRKNPPNGENRITYYRNGIGLTLCVEFISCHRRKSRNLYSIKKCFSVILLD